MQITGIKRDVARLVLDRLDQSGAVLTRCAGVVINDGPNHVSDLTGREGVQDVGSARCLN